MAERSQSGFSVPVFIQYSDDMFFPDHGEVEVSPPNVREFFIRLRQYVLKKHTKSWPDRKHLFRLQEYVDTRIQSISWVAVSSPKRLSSLEQFLRALTLYSGKRLVAKLRFLKNIQLRMSTCGGCLRTSVHRVTFLMNPMILML
jgi:hypothetical protein